MFLVSSSLLSAALAAFHFGDGRPGGSRIWTVTLHICGRCSGLGGRAVLSHALAVGRSFSSQEILPVCGFDRHALVGARLLGIS